jgi:diacylglycerol kinase (ATP)
MRRVLFIYNPIAGHRHNEISRRELDKIGRRSGAQFDFVVTLAPGHATEIAIENRDRYDLIVAVGGDGTVNEIGKALVGANTALGILPKGSGNGLARELNMGADVHKALQMLMSCHVRNIDTLSLNGRECLNVAGTGFDADVAFAFSQTGKRGFLSYVKSTIEVFRRHRPIQVLIEIEGMIIEELAFLVSFANSRQFGNNAYIAPKAQLEDGLFDICILTPFPWWYAPVLAFRLFNKSIHRSRFYRSYQASSALFSSEEQVKWHIDGEPVLMEGPIRIELHRASLKVLAV